MISKYFAACLGSAALLLAMPAAAVNLAVPHIKSVVFSVKKGTYTATITGFNFGATPAEIPCTACQPLELQVVNVSNQPAQEVINVTSWSDTAITVTGIQASKGDSLRIAVYNATAGNVDTWGGFVSPNKKAPVIDTIASSGSGKDFTLTIDGSGFGAAPSEVGTTGDSPYFVFSSFNASAPGTDGFPWNAGYCGQTDCNGVTVVYTAWSDNEIVISGFGDEYAQDFWTVNPHDAYCIGVWSTNGDGTGTDDGTFKCKRVPKDG